jgi:1,4-alpha-glucan branching enzyme
MRKGKSTGDIILIACNFTPVPRLNYHVGAPRGGWWREILNSDAKDYNGSGLGNAGGVEASAEPIHGRPNSLTITLPPLAVVYFKSG